MSDDLITNLQLIRLQGQAQETNNLLARQARAAEAQLEEMRKKKEEKPFVMPPPREFNLLALKNEMAEIVSRNDPTRLPELRRFSKKLKEECDRFATKITSYIHQEVGKMEETIEGCLKSWEPRYAAAVAEQKAEKQREIENQKVLAEKARAAAAQKLAAEEADPTERARKIEKYQYWINLKKAVEIEKSIMTAKRKPQTWPEKLGAYLWISSVVPLDTIFLAAIFPITDTNAKVGLFIVLWIAKLLIGVPLLYWGRGYSARAEKQDIKNYLANRRRAFAEAGIPPSFMDQSHNEHMKELHDIIFVQRRINPEEEIARLKALE